MKAFSRICIQDYVLEATNGDRLELKRGREYTTSREKEGEVCVFTNFWVWVPSHVFAGALPYGTSS